MKLAAVIFDMDGVLCSTTDYHFQSWKEMAEDAGIPFSRSDNKALRGLTRRRSLETILGERELPEEEMQALMAQKNERYLELIADLGPEDILPGAERLLEEVAAAGLKIAVASGSSHAQLVLERLGLAERVDAIVDGSMVERSKPAPNGFLLAASLLEVPPERCLVVEDAPAGVEAAHAAGMPVVGIGPAVSNSTADATFPSLEGVHLDDLLAVASRAREAMQRG